MGRGPTKKGISKKTFDLDGFKVSSGLDGTVKEKPLEWIPFSKDFHKEVGLPGLPKGYFTLMRGYSNTGKSTGVYEAIAGCQKTGVLPVIIDTEGNFNWEYAKNVGVEFDEVIDEDTGEIMNYVGNFIFVNGDDLLQRYANVDYSNGKVGKKPLRNEPVIEDVARFITELLDEQAKEDTKLGVDLCFLWDSAGSLNGFKSVKSKANNNMWNAGSMESAFKSIMNHRIPSSRREGKEFTNTLGFVQKVWLDNDNRVIRHKGGEALFYGCRLIYHYGGIISHGTKKLKATSGGKDYQFGVETKIRAEKNQVNGIEWKGKICSTPHGYISPDNLNDYKKKHRKELLKKLNLEYGEIMIVKEDGEMGSEDLKE